MSGPSTILPTPRRSRSPGTRTSTLVGEVTGVGQHVYATRKTQYYTFPILCDPDFSCPNLTPA